MIVAIGVLLGVGGCQREQGGSSKTVVTIGAVLPLTGDVANYGKDSSDGINLAVERANQRSGKYTYRVVYQDSKGQGAEAVAAARKLLSVDKAVVIIGDNVSGPTVAMVPVTDAARTAVISPSASTPKLSGMSKYFFRVYPSDAAEGSFMADVAASRLGLHQVAILYINNDFGVGLRDVFSHDFTAKGGKVLSVQGYNEDQTDFRPYLARIKQDRPDAVYLAGYYKDGGAILKQAKEMGLNSKFLGSTTHEDPQLIKIAKDAADGLLYPYSTGYNANSSDVPVQTFKTAFHEKYKRDPGLVAALGYDCARLVIDAVEYGGPSRQGIRDFFARTSNYEGATGRMAFDANGDVHKPVLLKTVRNGQFVNL
jgi:branched-chain amino acid transport system substrate-binding protein